MTFGSLFAGIGGFDLGLERSGMTCMWQCEIDKYANQILKKHWPEVKKYDDIRQLTNPEPVDLICGGFPCQDLSVAGNRDGLSGQRSGLFFEMARIINEVRPRWFILENVPGLLSSKNGQDMQTVLETLVKLGYSVAYRVLDSKNFGVAQRRKRVFIIGSFGNADSIKVLFEPESIKLNLPTGKRKKCADANTVGSLTSRDFKGIGSTIDDKIIIDPNAIGEPRIYTKTTPTLNTSQRQPCINQNGLRRLTPTEYERLQGFPDGWTNCLSDTQRYKTLGNAVTVNVIEWIGKRIANKEAEKCDHL